MLYLFEVAPPLFIYDLPIVNISRWNNSFVTLPNIIDPNNLSWSIELDFNSPKWITLNRNGTLLFNTTDSSYNISETTIVSLKLINEKNAWRIYNLTIKLDSYSSPSFPLINNFSVNYNVKSEFQIEKQSNDYDFLAVDCISNLTIPWIKYNKLKWSLQVNPFKIYLISQCAKLSSIDSCNNKKYSNDFFITIKYSLTPPAIGNTFGPLNVYTGESKLFLIPKDLFISNQLISLQYATSVLNWSVNSILYTNIAKSDKDGLFYLYILSLDAKICSITINATDSDNQSAETIVQVNVLNWASKDWLECRSQYQSDWIKCKENYKLGVDGGWYRNTNYFSYSVNSLYDIWGLIILGSLSISLIIVLIIGIRSLYLIEYSHTVIIFIASSSNQDLIRLISWFQIFKFDFGFLDQLHMRDLLFWNIESTEMTSIHFYCQSTILNYFYLLIIIFLTVLFLMLLKFASNKFRTSDKIYLCIVSKIDRQKIFWIFIYLFLPFIWVNLLSDIINIHDHILYSLTSLTAFSIAIIFLMIRYPEFFTLNFMKNIESNASPIIILFSILKSIWHAFLFLYRDQPLRIILLLIEFGIHLPIILKSFIDYEEIKLFELYSTKMRGVKKKDLFINIFMIFKY